MDFGERKNKDKQQYRSDFDKHNANEKEDVHGMKSSFSCFLS
jgi:hypothetical protein